MKKVVRGQLQELLSELTIVLSLQQNLWVIFQFCRVFLHFPVTWFLSTNLVKYISETK